MSFEAYAITGKIGLDENPAIESLRHVVKGAEEMKDGVIRHARDAGKHAGEKLGESTLENLKGVFGRGSVLKESFQALAGGGVLIGARLVGDQLNEMTKNALELSDALREDKISGGEAFESIMATVPGIGGFWQAGRNIHELLFREKAEIDAINESTKLTGESFSAWADGLKVSKDMLADVAVRIKAIGNTMSADLIGGDLAHRAAGLSNEGLALPGTLKKSKDDELKPLFEDRSKQQAAFGSFLDIRTRAAQKLANALAEEKDRGITASDTDALKKALGEANADVVTAQNQFRSLNDQIKAVTQSYEKMGDEEKKALSVRMGLLTNDVLKKFNLDPGSALGGMAITSDMKAAYLGQVKDLATQARQIGMTESQKKLDDLNHMPGSTLADQAGAKRSLDALDAGSIKESLLTPLEKFNKQMESLRHLHDTGDLSDNLFNKAAAKANTDAFGPTKLPGIFRAGSAEAQAARFDAGKPKDPLIAIGEKHTTLLQKILDKFSQLEVEETVAV